jgi:hypothetical protein
VVECAAFLMCVFLGVPFLVLCFAAIIFGCTLIATGIFRGITETPIEVWAICAIVAAYVALWI